MFNISHQYIQLFSSTLASTLAAWAMVPSVFAGSAVINLAYQGIMEDCQAFKANEDDNSLSHRQYPAADLLGALRRWPQHHRVLTWKLSMNC